MVRFQCSEKGSVVVSQIMNEEIKPKRPLFRVGCIVIGVLVLCGMIAGKLLSIRRVNNIFNPKWIVHCRILDATSRPVGDASVLAKSLIGNYFIGRLMEKSAELDTETVRVNSDGTFSFEKRADSVYFEVKHPRWGAKEIVLSISNPNEDAIHSPGKARELTVVLTGTNELAAVNR